MYHFFVTPEQVGETDIRIVGSDVNHIKNVLRMRPEEEVVISNGEGKDYHCAITSIMSEYVEARINSIEEKGSELPAKLFLFQGLPKSDKMELIIQKAVELGVFEVIPVVTKRAVVKLDEKKEAVKLKRWNGIAESAAKQSKRQMIPQIMPVMSLKEAFIYSKDFDINVIPYENCEGIKDTKEIVSRVTAGIKLGIFIGPEGGFDDDEIESARSWGVRPITLGKRILRTETAGMALLSVLMFQLEN